MLHINYPQWLKDTDLGFGKMRSSQLRALDAALLAYTKAGTPENASKIAVALEQWERSRKSTNASERDKNGAVTALKVQLESGQVSGEAFRDAKFSKEELEAFKYLLEQRKNTLIATFHNASVVFVGKKPDLEGPVSKIRALVSKATGGAGKVQSAVGYGKDAFSAGQKAATVGSKIAPVANAMQKVGSALAPVIQMLKDALMEMAEKFFEVAMSALGAIGQHILSLITQVAGMVAPYVGHLLDAKDTIVGWTKTGIAAYARYDIGKRSYAIETGAPLAAFEGVKVCLNSEVTQAALVATNATLAFTAKTALAFADYGAASGTAVGIVSALAELTRMVFNLALEYRATRELKKRLASPSTLDISVFKTYPLMGAYMLTSATLSDLIPISSFGTPGWMDIIEKNKKGDFDGIYSKSEELIQKSAFEITGLPKRRILKGTLGTKAGLAKDMLSGVAGSVKDALLG